MLSLDEKAFTIGFEGNTALVDKGSLASNQGLDPLALARKGLFRPAFAKALYAGDEAAIAAVMAAYNEMAGSAYKDKESFARLFGVYVEDIQRCVKY
jgi:hypothetical protein